MAKTRYLGLGTVLSVDYDADADYDTISLIIDATPPPRERAEVDDTTLEDTLETMTLGIELHSKYQFTMKWDSADAVDIAIMTTLFESKATVNWKIVFTGSATKTWIFPGKVQKAAVGQVKNKEHYTADIVVNRTGAIAIT